MNRSRYVTRPLDATDRAIIAALAGNSRITVRERSEQIEMSSTSVTERIHKQEDAGATRGCTMLFDPMVFGIEISAYDRMCAMPGEMKGVKQILIDL